jgi:hypothetical protein
MRYIPWLTGRLLAYQEGPGVMKKICYLTIRKVIMNGLLTTIICTNCNYSKHNLIILKQIQMKIHHAIIQCTLWFPTGQQDSSQQFLLQLHTWPCSEQDGLFLNGTNVKLFIRRETFENVCQISLFGHLVPRHWSRKKSVLFPNIAYQKEHFLCGQFSYEAQFENNRTVYIYNVHVFRHPSA